MENSGLWDRAGVDAGGSNYQPPHRVTGGGAWVTLPP